MSLSLMAPASVERIGFYIFYAEIESSAVAPDERR